MTNEESIFIVFNNNAPGLVDGHKHIRWCLTSLIIRGYEVCLTPDGDVSSECVKQMKALRKLLSKLIKENRSKRKDRWYRHVLTAQLMEVHEAITFISDSIKYRCKDTENHASTATVPSEPNITTDQQ